MNIEEAIEILSDDVVGYAKGHEKYEEAVKTLLTAYEKEKEIVDKINKLNIPVDTLIAEFERLEDLEDDRDMLKSELEKEKEKNKKAIDFINNENNYFEDGENWQNILKIKDILEE